MGTGFLARGECFNSVVEGRDAYYSAITPFSYWDSVAGKLVNIRYSPASGVPGSWVKITDTGGVVVNTMAPAVGLPSCVSPTELFSEGVSFGWSIVAVLALAWSCAIAGRALKWI